mgnify:CR=1 FL=1
MKIEVKDIIFGVAAGVLVAISCNLAYKQYKRNQEIKALQSQIEFYTDSLNRYTKLYSSGSFSDLKKENKELYNQLKDKEALVEAIKFEYKYKYESKEEEVSKPIETDSLYHFNVQTDTMGYDLKIWSTHLQKYKLLFNLTNNFTISRQQTGDNNRLEITSQLPGRIENVTSWTKKEKKQRFSIGPSIGVGYGLTTKKPDIFVGATLTYNLWN